MGREQGVGGEPSPSVLRFEQKGVGGLEEKPPSPLRLALRAREGWAAGYRTEHPLCLEFGAREGVGARELHGFTKPAGFATGFSGVRVGVQNSVPQKNPYPWHGYVGWCQVDGG